LFSLETQDALLLIFLDLRYFREDLLLLIVQLLLLLLLLGLGEILVNTLIKVVVFQIFLLRKLTQHKAREKVFQSFVVKFLDNFLRCCIDH